MRVFLAGTAVLAVWLATPEFLQAHCDTMNGPVVTEAQAALEKGDVTPVLKWVRPEDEEEVRAAFKRTMAARSAGQAAREVADLYFFETVVRLHRASEGEPYTGLKPAGPFEPPVSASEKAIAEGSAAGLVKEIGQSMQKGVQDRFQHLMETRKHRDESVAAGREYVEAYVQFFGYVEGLYATTAGETAEH